jgi:maltose/moltooligosaccharide transporter
MMIQTLSFGFVIKNFMYNNAVNAILLAGVFLTIAALLALTLRSSLPKEE